VPRPRPTAVPPSRKTAVAAQRSRQFHQLLYPSGFLSSTGSASNTAAAFAGTAAQAAAERYAFFQNEPKPSRLPRGRKHAICRFFNNIARNINV